ncbi:glycosyltransferase [Microbacterium schleiferi]|uniref:Glycosyltransferase n=1 Tax=Microbacterium schleiferi TaxID=69362 RepID=A0ABU7V5H8_9MICO
MLRVAHVVTYASADGAFGGPLAVAIAQARELARRSHNVRLFAGWDGALELSVPGVEVHLSGVRQLGPRFSGMRAPGLRKDLSALLPEIDLVHVHLGRDLVTSQAAMLALRAGKPLIVQTHGMVQPSRRIVVRAFDAVLTRKILRQAAACLVLGDSEDNALATVAPSAARIVLPNGIARTRTAVERDPHLVVFLARLHPRKRVHTFLDAAEILQRREVHARFEIYGPDEGDLPGVVARLRSGPLSQVVSYRGSVPPGGSLEPLSRASVYVLPSRGEVFPMTVLEALSVGTTTVITRDSEISQEFARRGIGEVVDGDARSIADAVERLLNDGHRRDASLAAAEAAIDGWIGIEPVVDRIEAIYESVVATGRVE